MPSVVFKNFVFDEGNGKLIGALIGGVKYKFGGDIWEITAKNENGTECTLIPKQFEHFKYSQKPDLLELCWNNEEYEVTVILSALNDKVFWNIAIQTVNYKLKKIVFPKFNKIDSIKNGKDMLLIPYQSGWIIENPVEKVLKNITPEKIPFWMGRGNGYYEADYPTALNFQFSAYTSENGLGCYLATEDERAYTKSFVYGSENGNLSFCVYNYPEGMGEVNSYCMPYDFAICFFEGNYEKAVNIYRDWAIKQKWAKKELSEKQINKNLININLWRINHTNYALGKRTEEYFETCKEIKKMTDANLGIHWYGWNMGEHDVNYPCYISKEQYALNWNKTLTEWNKKFDEIDVVKIPYVNARLWDKYTDAFEKENAIRYSIKDENGNTYKEPWKGDGLTSMCPSTFGWQKKVSDFCDEYINNYGFDGAYLDQIASFRATLCFDKTHPHAIGGGCWWNDKYHDLIINVKKRLGNGKFLTSESCCETYIDVIDMFLILDNDIVPNAYFNMFTEDYNSAESVPLFSMIYGKHSLIYGSICRLCDDKSTFEYKFARNILWGFVPSIEGFSMNEIENHKDYFEIIKSGVEFYDKNKELFIYGRVISLPVIECENVTLGWKDYPSFQKEYPGIITALWETKSNEVKQVFYNCLNYDKTISIDGKRYTIKSKQYFVK